ncbi:hypothetical protein [Actinacidiphila acidipaludis]|uniref:Uncharacterized protein n=1 Tax=Actinacidiphila acidipaludis TaxID=2873382 RepID=A0ABS7QDH6_9ACTN|nr:hypothetical protein [Streptomyces acidipaludis]MBY8880876.1 hypothetical protein [Streptomyces acidipaludis]
MAAVGEFLLTHDVADVSRVAAFTGAAGHPHADCGCEVSGVIGFSPRFQREALLRGPGEACLVWCGNSGWSLTMTPWPARADGLPAPRWLGMGLVPPPSEVHAFILALQLDIDSRSDARPAYRQAGEDLDGLASRLAEYLPHTAAAERGAEDFPLRFGRGLDAHYRVEAEKALGDRSPTGVVLTAGELAALEKLVKYVEAAEAPPDGPAENPVGPGALARRLIEELTRRRTDV